mmetsp:Transcript_123112/g.245079  ORF Transcript_123112/g.245079 Transcript_123112/m.245079 type:complete len:220 (+) Transcript_123112:59-718(+)
MFVNMSCLSMLVLVLCLMRSAHCVRTSGEHQAFGKNYSDVEEDPSIVAVGDQVEYECTSFLEQDSSTWEYWAQYECPTLIRYMGSEFDDRVNEANPDRELRGTRLATNVASHFLGVKFKASTPDYFMGGDYNGCEKMKKRECQKHADCKQLAKQQWDRGAWEDFSGCEGTCDRDKLVAMGLKKYEGKCVRFVHEGQTDDVEEEEFLDEGNTLIRFCMPY